MQIIFQSHNIDISSHGDIDEENPDINHLPSSSIEKLKTNLLENLSNIEILKLLNKISRLLYDCDFSKYANFLSKKYFPLKY